MTSRRGTPSWEQGSSHDLRAPQRAEATQVLFALFRNGTNMYPSGAPNPRFGARVGSALILPMYRLLRTELRVKTNFKILREEHRLVARAFQTAEGAQARRILLASPRTGDGKSHLAECIEKYANLVTDEPLEVESFGSWSYRREQPEGYVWVDGVAVLEGEGAAVLTPSIRASLDGALLLARGMVTTRAELRECADRLRVLGMPVLGGVWNDVACPPPMETARDFAKGLRTWPPQLPPGVFARHLRGSS